MGGLESFSEEREEKKRRKPREKKESPEKKPVSQKESFDDLLKFCELDSSGLDKISDAIKERLKDPWSFIPEKDQRGGCRAKFIGELNKLLQAVDLPDSSTVNVLGIDMPVFFDRERFKNLQKYCSAIHNVTRKGTNPLYNKGASSDKVFEIPFFDIDMCLSYGWLTKGGDTVEYLEPDALANLWNKKIEKKSTEKNKDDLEKIYENAVGFDSSNEPTSIEEFETVIWEEFSQMMEQVKASEDFIDLKYGHLIGPDYFIAILSKEVLGNPGLTIKARRFLLNKLLAYSTSLSNPKILKLGVDATGLELDNASKHYAKILDKDTTRKDVIQVTACGLMDTLLISSARVERYNVVRNNNFLPLVEESSKLGKVDFVAADKGYDAHNNHKFVMLDLMAKSLIKLKNVSTKRRNWRKNYRKIAAKQFDEKLYHQRSKIETIFSMVKRRYGATIK